MSYYKNLPSKKTPLNAENLSRTNKYNTAVAETNADYKIDLNMEVEENIIVKIHFEPAVDNQKPARLSIDNGTTYHNIDGLSGEEIENKNIELVFKVDKWVKKIEDIKEILTFGLSNDYTITQTNNVETLPLNRVVSRLANDGFELTATGLKIKKGVKFIKISGGIMWFCVSNTTTYTYISFNGVNITQHIDYKYASRNSVTIIPTLLLEVNEGDEIEIKIYGNQGDKIFYPVNRTYLTVEVIG